MRISDWSSDVCSSDLLIEAPHRTLNLAADYRIPLGAEGSLSFHADATNVTRQYFSATNIADFRLPSFWDVGARISDRIRTLLNSSHYCSSRLPSSPLYLLFFFFFFLFFFFFFFF